MRHRGYDIPESLRVPLSSTATRPKQPWDRDIQLMQMCRDATYHTLKPLEPEILAVCEASLQHNFLSGDNQKKLESGLLRALNIISSLDRISSDEVIQPPPAQKRYIPPPRLPEKPTMPQIPKARLSPEDEAKGKDLISRIAVLRDRYMKQKLEYEAMQRDLQDDLAEAEDKRNTLKRYFEKVNHEVAVARSGLDTVKDTQLIEIRGYQKPPDQVRKVLEAVLLVLNEPEAGNWGTMQHYIRQPDFIPNIRGVSDISKIEPKSLARIQQITRDPDFTTEKARKASEACAPLVQWVHAMVHFEEVSKSAQGLKDEVERLDAEISARQSELANGDRRLRMLENELNNLQREYDENYGPSAVSRLQDKARTEAMAVYRTAVADWKSKCNVLKEKHLSQYAAEEQAQQQSQQRAKPLRPLLTRTVQTVEETRSRCQRLVDAIQATMEQLKGPHGNVLVIEKKLYPRPVARPVAKTPPVSSYNNNSNSTTGTAAQSRVAMARRSARSSKMFVDPLAPIDSVADEDEKPKRKRTPHTAPWRQNAAWTFDTNRRTQVKLPEKTKEDAEQTDPQQQQNQDQHHQQHQQQNDPNNNYGGGQQQLDQQQQGGWQQYQQQQQDPYGGGGGYDQFQQQQQQPQNNYNQWGGGGGYDQQYGPAGGQPQQQQWGGGAGYDQYGGGGGGGGNMMQQQQQPQQNQWGGGSPSNDAYGGGGGGFGAFY